MPIMSVLDQIKTLFSKKPAQAEADTDSSLSLAMPDQGGEVETLETLLVSRQAAPVEPNPVPAPLQDTEVIALPGLGARPAAQHQRVLGILLGASLLLLAGVAVFALNQLRVLVLFYSYRSNRELFDQLHGLVTPLVLICAAVALFAVWADWVHRGRRDQAQPQPPEWAPSAGAGL